jgi:hypothetical protein
LVSNLVPGAAHAERGSGEVLYREKRSLERGYERKQFRNSLRNGRRIVHCLNVRTQQRAIRTLLGLPAEIGAKWDRTGVVYVTQISPL